MSALWLLTYGSIWKAKNFLERSLCFVFVIAVSLSSSSCLMHDRIKRVTADRLADSLNSRWTHSRYVSCAMTCVLLHSISMKIVIDIVLREMIKCFFFFRCIQKKMNFLDRKITCECVCCRHLAHFQPCTLSSFTLFCFRFLIHRRPWSTCGSRILKLACDYLSTHFILFFVFFFHLQFLQLDFTRTNNIDADHRHSLRG